MPGATPAADGPPGSIVADDNFYKSFSERRLTGYGAGRRSRIEQSRLAIVNAAIAPPGDMVEIGPGHGTLGELAVAAGWRYHALEASATLIDVLARKGLSARQAWIPPIPEADASHDVIYADQVMEHMSGIDAARQFTAEAFRVLRPGGVFFVVVPDYLKERTFFWDVDYTHNFVTTERRCRQLFNDNGLVVERMVRSIGLATGLRRDALAAGAALVNFPGANTLARRTGTEDLLFRIRKNLFETLAFVARKPR